MADPTDSEAYNVATRAKMRAQAEKDHAEAEAAEQKRVYNQQMREKAARLAEMKDLERIAGTMREAGSREMILDRIRQMREEKLPEPEVIIPRTGRMLEEFNAEIEAGRAAVARNEAELERNREIQRKYEAEQRAKEGEMKTVHHPNPTQNEEFPASGATLGKLKR